MYLISPPIPTVPSAIWIAPASRPTRTISRRASSGDAPLRTVSIANADSTAAAGAQGALISRSVPPSDAATRPITTAPMIPASAPIGT